MMEKIMTETTKHKTTLLIILALLMLFALLTGCSLFGGAAIKPVAKPDLRVDAVLKQQDKMNQEFKEIKGSVETNKTNIATTITSVNSAIEQNTDNHNENESLKSLMTTVALIIGGFMILLVALYIILQKLAPGSTLRNVLNPWRKKE